MLKVVNKNNHNELYATGLSEYSKKDLQEKIDSGYFHKYLVKELKNIELVIINTEKEDD